MARHPVELAALRAQVTSRHTRLPVPTLGTSVGVYGIRQGDTVTAVTASARVVSASALRGQPVAKAAHAAWQDETWDLRRAVGEFRFAGDRVAKGLSQVHLLIVKGNGLDAEPAPVESGPAFDLFKDLFANVVVIQQVMMRAGQHLAFAGETYLLIETTDDDGLVIGAFSSAELSVKADTVTIDDGDSPKRLVAGDYLLIRCWSPDPQRGGLADSPAQAVLPVARELKGLGDHVAAQVDSRLAGAGLLVVPDNIEVLAGQGPSNPGNSDVPDGEPQMDSFVAALLDAMTTPIANRDSAAAVVPLIVKASADAIDKIKHITFSTPLDTAAKELRDEAIRRVALGMDAPPEVLLGMGSSNHWSAWQVSEDEVRYTISPLAATVCHTLTAAWLRPALTQLGVPDADQYMVWFDTTPLSLRPDRSADSLELFDRGLVSGEAVRRESGFPETDAPTAPEVTPAAPATDPPTDPEPRDLPADTVSDAA